MATCPGAPKLAGTSLVLEAAPCPVERVAKPRRELPPGGEVAKDYRFEREHGPVRFEDLFSGKNMLVINSFMQGPQRKQPCPMCTTLMDAWSGEAPATEALQKR